MGKGLDPEAYPNSKERMVSNDMITPISILIRFHPTRFCLFPNSLPKSLALKEGHTTDAQCVAPWDSAQADLLINEEFSALVGVSYPIAEDSDRIAKSIYESSRSDAMNYVHRRSNYAREIYGNCGNDWFEIMWSTCNPTKHETALSLDGFWYFGDSASDLMAFGFSNIDETLTEYSLSLVNLPDSLFLPEF